MLKQIKIPLVLAVVPGGRAGGPGEQRRRIKPVETQTNRLKRRRSQTRETCGQSVNIRLDVTITDQRGTASPTTGL